MPQQAENTIESGPEMNEKPNPARGELPKAYDPAAIEDRWAKYWVEERLFEVKTPARGTTGPRAFTVLLPPPNVTGNLHMGHMFEHTETDILVRWHRMRGETTLWLPGTDHAGIATQMLVERQLVAEGKSRQGLGREAFVERVWEWRRHYGGAILSSMKRIGDTVDWSREYFTMDERLSVAVREAFVRLYEDGLIYRGAYIVNWCPRCQTAISDLEVSHEEQQGKLWEIRYPIVGSPGEFLTVATTRPETMLGDVAVAVNPLDERYTNLIGKMLQLPLTNREIPVIADEWVKSDFGTGAVKVTPAHDANDFAIGQRHNLPAISVMDETAHMNAEAGPAYAGLDRYDARKKVLEDLEAQGLLGQARDHVNSIGKCARCQTIVEPRLSTQWFVAVNKRPKNGGDSMAELARKVVREEKPGRSDVEAAALYARELREDLPGVDEQHLRLVYLAPAVVGTSHSRVALRKLQADHRRAPGSDALRALRERADHPGNRCSRHLVLVRIAAGYGFWMAAACGAVDARSGRVLSHVAAGDGF